MFVIIHTDLSLLQLNTAFCTIRMMKHTLTQDTLNMNYFAYFHSMLNYGTIFWGSSRYSNKIFIVEKEVLKTITGFGNQDLCYEMFKDVHIITLTLQYTPTHTYTHTRKPTHTHPQPHTLSVSLFYVLLP
jgi:hypothetical protein